MNHLNQLIKQFHTTITQSDNLKNTLNDLTSSLSYALHANIVILDHETLPVFANIDETLNGTNTSFNYKPIENTVEPIENIELGNLLSVAFENKYQSAVYPLFCGLNRLGFLLLWRRDKFSPEELCVVRMYELLIILLLQQIFKDDQYLDNLMLDNVKSSLSSLSFSELEAIIQIFNRLDSKEGVVVASHVANTANVARSIIVNALRKLESAGLIETRSLGMKGTYIKVLNEYLFTEINKLRT